MMQCKKVQKSSGVRHHYHHYRCHRRL